MTQHDSTSRRSSLPTVIIKGLVIFLVIVLILGAAALVILPPLISSDSGRSRVVSLASERLQRPVSLEDLSFSWQKGFSLENLTIRNRDDSPFLDLAIGRIDLAWSALAKGTVVIESLLLDGLSVVITRDKKGNTSIDDLLAPPESERAKEDEKKAEEGRRDVSAIFLDAHVQDSRVTFIDQRLNRTTRIEDLIIDLTVQSLAKPIEFLLKGDVVVDGKPSEPLNVSGTALLAPEGRIDPMKARGTLTVNAAFAAIKADFDLSQFTKAAAATGATLSGDVDLGRTAQVAAGIVGLPPDFSIQGQLHSDLKAQGDLKSTITVNGQTRLTDLVVTGGPFAEAPLREPRVDFRQRVTMDFVKNTITVQPVSLKSRATSVTLDGTIRDFRKEPLFDLKLSGVGDLRELTRISRAMADLPPDLQITGRLDLALAARGTQDALHLAGRTIAQELTVAAPALAGHPFEEKRLEVIPDLLVNAPRQALTINSLEIRGTALSADGKGTWNGDGNAAVQATLTAQLGALRQQLSGLLPPAFPRKGSLASKANMQGNVNKILTITGDHVITDAVVVTSSDSSGGGPSSITLPQTTLHHEFAYDKVQDSVTLSNVTGRADFFSLDGSGTVTRLSAEPHVTSQIKLQVAMTQALAMLKDRLPQELSAQGDAKLDLTAEGTVPSSKEVPFLANWSGTGSLSAGTIVYQGAGSVENFHTTQFSLDKGKASIAAECLLNQGPTQVSATVDLKQSKPAVAVATEGKNVAISQSVKVLGYVIPIFIGPSGELTGKGNFSAQASWQGTDWESEISRNITGKGTVRLVDGVIRSQGVLYQILRILGEKETFSFDEIVTGFHLADAKVYNDKTQVNGKDLDFNVEGWTSLVYVPEKKGNPMEYAVTGDFASRLGKDAQKALSALGGTAAIPIVIGGTVQDPRVTVKMPKVRDLLKGLIPPPEGKESGTGLPFLFRKRQPENQPATGGSGQ